MRLIKKEALKGDASVMQPMIDALNTPVKYVKEPGPQPVNSDVSPLIIASEVYSHFGSLFPSTKTISGFSSRPLTALCIARKVAFKILISSISSTLASDIL